MGRRIEETFHLDRASADAAQSVKGTPGYSEVYGRGRVSLQSQAS